MAISSCILVMNSSVLSSWKLAIGFLLMVLQTLLVLGHQSGNRGTRNHWTSSFAFGSSIMMCSLWTVIVLSNYHSWTTTDCLQTIILGLLRLIELESITMLVVISMLPAIPS